MKKHFLYLSLALSLMACNKEKSDAEIAADDDAAIQAYMTKKGLKAQKTPEGIYYIIEVEGTGGTPVLSNKVKAKYKGYFLDDAVFDQSTAGAEFPLSGVIQGWQIGMQKFKKGSKGKLLIPSAYAYGRRGNIGIPANTPIAFDIELLDFF